VEIFKQGGFYVLGIGGARTRNGAVDAAKLMAAAAVVWIHVVNCEESHRYIVLGRFAVPFFTCAAVFFVLEKAFRDNSRPLLEYCAQRARQLYVPFLTWALVYLGIREVKHFFIPGGSPIVLSPAVLLNGTTHHLWFLPFICIVSIAAFAVGRGLRDFDPKHWKWLAIGFVSAGLLLAVGIVPTEVRAAEVPISYFKHQSLDTVPAVFFGVGVFFLFRVITPTTLLRWAMLVIPIACTAWEFFNGGSSVAAHLAGAGLLLFTVLQPNYRWTATLAPWADLAFVIYLVHVLLIEVLETVENRFGIHTLPGDVSLWALAFVGSALIARVIVSYRPLRATLS
jgi:surface polysaccharide O-acyltransferase-like enzyme